MSRPIIVATLLASASLGVLTVSAQPEAAPAPVSAPVQATTGAYLPDPDRPYPERVLWGDEHVHTGWSMDAGLAGANLTPEDAVRFVRGETVNSNSGQPTTLRRPFDWVAVTDHSDGMGTITELKAGHPEFMAEPITRGWSEKMRQGPEQAQEATLDLVRTQANHRMPDVMKDPKWVEAAWQATVDVMEKYNQPGTFTAFIAYEWTSNALTGENLHRNVIFRDDADKTRGLSPLTTWASSDPATLWAWLANYEATTGGQALAITHNGNLSNGRMFEEQQYDGSALTREWAEARARWEPLYELFQYKGFSEAHPSLSPTDEFAGDELWDTGNLAGVVKTPEMLRTEYWREALKSGMRLEGDLGTNPFKLGSAGGSDTHTGLAGFDEDSFMGKLAGAEPHAGRWDQVFAREQNYVRKDWTQAAAGYTGVWAIANTREAIWDAMKRRETYATSGPRMTVRFFGGYDFGQGDADGARLVANGYARGVPMGGDLQAARPGQAPTFIFAAMKDTIGANLDRVQVVKGWVDAAGVTHESIINVAWSDRDTRTERGGRLTPVGSTVNVTTATYTNTIGAPELIGWFKDESFDPRQRAFYYLRVIEIPTPRWTAYDAVKFGDRMSAEVPMTVRERAVTSPIWYNPA